MLPLIVSIIVIDQLTKTLLNAHLGLQKSVCLIPGFFYLTLVHNTGAAFGVLKNQLPLFVATSFFAIVLIVMNLKKNASRHKTDLWTTALCLILAGAIGNLTDRLLRGYVIDFLDFRFWPVFNIADSAITIGALLLGYSLLFQSSKGTTNRSSP